MEEGPKKIYSESFIPLSEFQAKKTSEPITVPTKKRPAQITFTLSQHKEVVGIPEVPAKRVLHKMKKQGSICQLPAVDVTELYNSFPLYYYKTWLQSFLPTLNFKNTDEELEIECAYADFRKVRFIFKNVKCQDCGGNIEASVMFDSSVEVRCTQCSYKIASLYHNIEKPLGGTHSGLTFEDAKQSLLLYVKDKRRPCPSYDGLINIEELRKTEEEEIIALAIMDANAIGCSTLLAQVCDGRLKYDNATEHFMEGDCIKDIHWMRAYASQQLSDPIRQTLDSVRKRWFALRFSKEEAVFESLIAQLNANMKRISDTKRIDKILAQLSIIL